MYSSSHSLVKVGGYTNTITIQEYILGWSSVHFRFLLLTYSNVRLE